MNINISIKEAEFLIELLQDDIRESGLSQPDQETAERLLYTIRFFYSKNLQL